MTNSNQNRYRIVIAASLLSLTACTTESWYQGAKSAQATHCMKEPISEYEDCMKQTEGGYHSYQEKREQLLQENQPDNED
jgi:hypothetical protein